MKSKILSFYTYRQVIVILNVMGLSLIESIDYIVFENYND